MDDNTSPSAMKYKDATFARRRDHQEAAYYPADPVRGIVVAAAVQFLLFS